MRIIIFDNEYIVGFANSIDEFIEYNNKKVHPYNYSKDKLKSVELTTDVFSMCRIEGQSNFQHYFKIAE